MNALKNVVGLFSSPAKIAPAKPSSAKKHDYEEVFTIKSTKKRRRSLYDPSEYQRAVYGTGETTTVSDEDDGEEKHEREIEGEEEEEDGDQAHEQLLQEQLRHVHPIATSKSVHKHTHAVPSVSYPELGGVRNIALDAARTSNDTLDKTERLLATKPDSEIKRKKLATIAQTRAKNNAILVQAPVEGYTQVQREETIRVTAARPRMPMDQAPITETASANTGLTCAENGDESSSEQVSTTQEDLNKDVESDWRTTKEKYHSSPATPQRRLSTVHQEPTSTSKLPNNHIPSHLTAWLTLSPSQKWFTDPNLHARQLHSNPRLILVQLPNEPAYAFRDTEMRDAIWALMHRIEDFARTFFPQQQQQHRRGAYASSRLGDDDGGNNNEDDSVEVVLNERFYSGLSPETARVIACVASGGPGGVSGWHDVFVNREKMQALVCGIIGNVVSEQVLQHGFLGGTEEGVQRVREVEKDMRDSDGEYMSLSKGGREGGGRAD
ncbi:hypothetical protein IG631_22068 [Alternaria alternata]|nr:hypothetical protein IG631_22068 [Alternaria alternata]